MLPDHFLQPGKRFGGFVLIRGLDEIISDHAPCEEGGSHGAKPQVFPVDLFAETEIVIGFLRVGLSGVTGKCKSVR